MLLGDGDKWFDVEFDGRRSGAIGKNVGFKARVRSAAASDVEMVLYRSGFEYITTVSIREV